MLAPSFLTLLFLGSALAVLDTDLDDSGCGDSKGCFRTPADCAVADCDAIVSWVDGGSTYDFEMNGKKDNPGWVAIGFSKDQMMGQDSVTACVSDGSTVRVKSTWNDGYSNSPLSDPNLGLTKTEATYVGNRIRCKFSRAKSVSGNNQFYDLAEKYYILLGVGPQSGGDVGYHGAFGAPSVSNEEINLADKVKAGGTTKSLALVKAHGSLMVIAWLLCATLGIFTARFYKDMWPGVEPMGVKLWFSIHRINMILTFILTIIAFILIFIHVGGFMEWESLTNKALRAHPFLGIIVTILVIVNPTMAIFRPHPGTPRRPIFNWAHWAVGITAHTLGIITIFFGVSLPQANVRSESIWILVAFVVGEIVLYVAAEVHKCQMRNADDKDKAMEMTANGGQAPEPTQPRGSTFLKVLHILMIVLCALITIAVIVLIAIA